MSPIVIIYVAISLLYIYIVFRCHFVTHSLDEPLKSRLQPAKPPLIAQAYQWEQMDTTEKLQTARRKNASKLGVICYIGKWKRMKRMDTNGTYVHINTTTPLVRFTWKWAIQQQQQQR